MTVRPPARNACAALACAALAITVAGCGGSTAGLIASAYSTPLQHDFETVLEAARTGNGACTATETALKHAEADVANLPPTVDAALRTKIIQGMSYLAEEALRECSIVKTTTTTTTTKSKTKTNSEITTVPEPTTTIVEAVTTTVSSVVATTPENGGGTVAPGGSNPGGSEASGEQAPANGAQQREPGT